MLTVGDLKRKLNGLHDDLPVFVAGHYGGYEHVTELHVGKLCFQACHAESAPWEVVGKAKKEHEEHGSIKAALIEY